MTLLHSRPCDQYVINEVLRSHTAGYQGLKLGPGDVLLDLGAHVGSCVQYALDHDVAHVVAVEMLPDTLGLLRRNFGQDPRVTIVPAAVVNENRGPTATTRRFRNPMGASVSLHNARAANGKEIEVPTVTLTGLINGYKPNKIKFDIENAEYETVLPNVEFIWNAGITHLAGELHTATDDTYLLARDLCQGLIDVGYKTSKPIKQYPAKKHGWNVHAWWWREEQE